MKIKNSWILLYSLIFMGFSSCEKGEPECYEPVSILTRNQFVLKQIVHYDSIYQDTIHIDTSVVSFKDTGLAAPAMFSLDMPQNIISYGGRNSTMIGIPFEPNIPSMRYVIQFDTTTAVYDTITYYYKTSNHFISNACGFTNYFHIDSIHITKNILDSSVLQKKDIVSGNDIQVLLYFF